MNKICTSIDQSKQLIKLGIDVNTADMYYMYRHWEIDKNTVGAQSDASIGFDLDSYYGADNGKTYHYIPAWSLSALLELIPPYLGEFNDGIDFGFGKAMNSKWYSAHYLQTYSNGDTKSVKTVTGDTAVDAAFEVVCWLLEHNKSIMAVLEFEYTGKNPPMRIRFGKLQIDNEHLESVECQVRQDGGYSAIGRPFSKGWHEGQVETLQALLKLRGKKVVSLDPEFIKLMHGLLSHHGYHNEEEEYLCGRLGGVQDVLETLLNAYSHLKHLKR